jgi:hypothetical protein
MKLERTRWPPYTDFLRQCLQVSWIPVENMGSITCAKLSWAVFALPSVSASGPSVPSFHPLFPIVMPDVELAHTCEDGTAYMDGFQLV